MLGLLFAGSSGLLVPSQAGPRSAVGPVSRAAFGRRDLATVALGGVLCAAAMPAPVLAEEEAKAEEPKKDPPKKKKGPCGDVECGPAAKGQKTALGFVTSETMPQFRPAGAVKSDKFKPPPLGKLDPKKTRPQFNK